jgi:hypothetical protein
MRLQVERRGMTMSKSSSKEGTENTNRPKERDKRTKTVQTNGSYLTKTDSRGRVLLKGSVAQFYDVTEQEDGVLILSPMELKKRRKSLTELLASVQDDDSFTEIKTGLVGKEVIES